MEFYVGDIAIRFFRENFMTAMNQFDDKEIRELLAKGWLTHDAMWFVSVYQDLGIEKANQLNLAAIRAQAPIEVARLQKALDLSDRPTQTSAELKTFMQAAFEITLPKSVFSKFKFGLNTPGVFSWEWEPGGCFAFKGMHKLGILNTYRCGVMYRIECWLDTLGIAYRMDPEITTCIMSKSGMCSGSISVDL